MHLLLSTRKGRKIRHNGFLLREDRALIKFSRGIGKWERGKEGHMSYYERACFFSAAYFACIFPYLCFFNEIVIMPSFSVSLPSRVSSGSGLHFLSTSAIGTREDLGFGCRQRRGCNKDVMRIIDDDDLSHDTDRSCSLLSDLLA